MRRRGVILQELPAGDLAGRREVPRNACADEDVAATCAFTCAFTQQQHRRRPWCIWTTLPHSPGGHRGRAPAGFKHGIFNKLLGYAAMSDCMHGSLERFYATVCCIITFGEVFVGSTVTWTLQNRPFQGPPPKVRLICGPYAGQPTLRTWPCNLALTILRIRQQARSGTCWTRTGKGETAGAVLGTTLLKHQIHP